MDSILSVTIRDTEHPCSPFKSTKNSFKVQVFNCDGSALVWKGLNFGAPGVQLTQAGAGGGRIHGQFRVPPGTYLVRAVGRCTNTVTDWAWVEVCCAQKVCVDLVLPTIFHCVRRTQAGLNHGTLRAEPVRDVVPPEVETANAALTELTSKLEREYRELIHTALPDVPSDKDITARGVEPSQN